MKILQATITYPPAVGGLDRHVKAVSDGLQQRGHQVTVYTTDLEQPMSRQRLVLPKSWDEGDQVRRFRAWRLPTIPLTISPSMGAQMGQTPADLIHAYCVWHSPTQLAWRISRKRRLPLVLNTVFSPRSGAFWKWYLNRVKEMAAEAACVIVLSQFERRLLADAGISFRRLEVIPPVVDLEPFRQPRAPIWERYGLQDRRVIVSHGRLAYGKRVDRLINALPVILESHPDAHLFIAGPDYGDEARLRGLVQSLDLNRSVTFAGFLSEEDLVSALQHAVLFAMTTDFELFGIVLIEAMAAGAPIVAPRGTAVPEVVRDGKTGLLYDWDSSEDLAAKVDSIFSRRELRLSLVEAGKSEAHSRFNFGACLSQIESVYEKALRGW